MRHRAVMGGNILESKVHIPVQPQGIVPRPRLWSLLEQNAPRYKLTLVCAPAGYGKTTLLADWARASCLPVAWLSITGEEDNVERFLRYLLASWESVQPEIMESPLGVLLGSQKPDIEAVLSTFIHAANEVATHLVFVLDDYHLLADPAIHDAITFILDHLPPQLHFILASRSDPPLPIARYRAHGQLLEFHADDLHCTRTETADFLNRLMELELSPDAVAALHTQTEGWIAGLQLMALTLRRRHTGATGTPVVSGRHRFIADYLSEDVLERLPAAVRDFLLRTSILERLCAPLCDAVMGEEGGQAMLETLERENLFIVPLDDSREWFRYHSLFADFLRGELNRRHPAEVAYLHGRAARWYAAHDLPEQAFRHAVAGDDVEQVVQICERYIPVKLMRGEFRVVAHWLESLPEQWYSGYPMLGLARAFFLGTTGAFDACAYCLNDVEQSLALADSQDMQWQMARVIAFRCIIACVRNDLARAETYADQALQNLPEEDVYFRASINHALGDTYRQNGRWEEAKACYLKALELFQHDSSFRFWSVHIFGALADLSLRRGRLRHAAEYWRKALAIIQERESWGSLPLPVTGWVYIRLGELLYEWNELAAACDHLSRGLERAKLGGDVRALIAGYLIAGRLKLTEGDVEAAGEYLEQTRALVDSAQFPDWPARFQRFQLEFWLAQDRLRAAVDWADELLTGDALEGQPESETAWLALARVLIVKEDAPSLERALALLGRLLEAAETEGRVGIQIEALALQALAHWRYGERADAMIALATRAAAG